jgi:2-C-methyl-D-erythritol 4-phosphate cytidylyltransferase/2-C-methyl-D-erythritol 2,4-cyclodiphosphate synthase
MAASPTVACLIVAAGRGLRAGGDIPKQYQQIGGTAMLARTVDAFLAHPRIGRVRVAIGAGDEDSYRREVSADRRLGMPILGAESRQGSVLAGLRALAAEPPDIILIHDGARPFVAADLIDRVLAALQNSVAVVPTLPVSSTLKTVDADGHIGATIPRDAVHAAETPQGFHFDRILKAHEDAAKSRGAFTDDAAVAEWAGIAVASVPGDPQNIKLTTAADVAIADKRLSMEAMLRLGDIRVGHGYDVHAFGPGRIVTLGGVSIPHEAGLVGHSDADVALHALTDAILGALGDGDIGAHFPPSDPKWRGASSDLFLADAVRRVRERGGVIAHLDVSILAEAPKIGPHREVMRRRIADIAGIAVDRVGIKATTNEGLGFVGRNEGIAAHAVATIRLPFGAKP